MTAVGVSGLALGRLGLDLGPVKAYAAEMKLEGAKEAISICPSAPAAAMCWFIPRTAKSSTCEGDPDFPISEGGLCAKGRLSNPCTSARTVRPSPCIARPAATSGKRKRDWMMERIARRIKDQRDKDFKEKTPPVWRSIAWRACSTSVHPRSPMKKRPCCTR